MIAWEGLAPVVKHADELSPCDVRQGHILWNVGQAVSGKAGPEDRQRAVEDELAIDADVERLAGLLELPGVKSAIGREPAG